VLGTTDDHVTVLDLLTYAGGMDNLAEVTADRRFRFVHGDICDRAAVQAAIDGHEVVVHFAAESHVDRSLLGPDAFVRTNCAGTNVLCDVARHVGVERFVHISTDEVYGSIEAGSFHESDALRPSSPYAASKAGSDLIALSHHTTHGLPVVVSRSSNNFGPRQFPEKVIPLFVTSLLDGRTVPLYGDGGNVRDWCFVTDHCRAIELLRRDGEIGQIYNIATGVEVTNRDLTARLLALTGRDERSIDAVADRPGHDRRYSMSAERIRRLGWRPEHDFDDALASTVAWYRTNRPWWEPRRARATLVRS
jgi:dTDP-glucose 4,6-dehydratase